jgi:hypothetical protein
MDPISVVGCIIGVAQAGDRLIGLLAKLKPAWTATRDVQMLIDELNDLGRVLEHLKYAVNHLPPSNSKALPLEVYESLLALVNGGGSVLMELEKMIEQDFLKASAASDRDLKVHRLTWARKISQVQTLRQKLKDVQLIIMVQASCINL